MEVWPRRPEVRAACVGINSVADLVPGFARFRRLVREFKPDVVHSHMVDDERLPMRAGEAPQMRKVRFRTLGCYPLTGAIESDAAALEDIIAEMLVATTSERQGRVIDQDPSASMEKKKQEGYF